MIFACAEQCRRAARRAVAGGAVRNALLGEPIADIDIATTLTPEAVMAAGVAGRASASIPLASRMAPSRSSPIKMPFEVTTLRVDVETDGRRAKVSLHRRLAGRTRRAATSP